MDNLYNSLAQTFGPLVQIIFFFFVLFLAAWCICAVAFFGERKLAQIRNRILWKPPFPILALGLLYGGLRFSGQLLYPTDGWDQWGPWNYTNQNFGAFIICGCLLIGTILAVSKEKIFLKN